MRKLNRRQFLLGGLLAGMTTTTIHELWWQRRQQQQQQLVSRLVSMSPEFWQTSLDSALSGDTKAAAAIEETLASVQLTPPTVPYEREISNVLIRCCRLGTEQYLYGKFDPNYRGAIAELPSFNEALRPFQQVASIRGPEEARVREEIEISTLSTLSLADPLQERLEDAENEIRNLAGQVITINRFIPVYWGFVLTSPQANIIAFRGTQRPNEWLDNFRAQKASATAFPRLNFAGMAHRGFINIYNTLAEATITAVRRLDPSRPCYIAGHSLGGALAVLAAQHIAQTLPALKPQIRLYTYATPRVGDRTFVETHSRLVPNSYRIINSADAFALLPPLAIGEYLPIGQLWSFTSQRGDFSTNHFISTYRVAIEQQQEIQTPDQ